MSEPLTEEECAELRSTAQFYADRPMRRSIEGYRWARKVLSALDTIDALRAEVVELHAYAEHYERGIAGYHVHSQHLAQLGDVLTANGALLWRMAVDAIDARDATIAEQAAELEQLHGCFQLGKHPYVVLEGQDDE